MKTIPAKPVFAAAIAENTQGSKKAGSGALLAGGITALLASTCCLGPLVLVALGFSGAWIGNLTALEPYRPFFIGAALIAMVRSEEDTSEPNELMRISNALFSMK